MRRERTATDATGRVKEQIPLALGGASYLDSDTEDWDYATANTKTHTHCYHVYPAMMIPQVARRLIRLYGRSKGLLLDPFCGSGTSLVEARLAGMNAVGVDLNPFAVLLARVKTTDYDLETAVAEAKRLRNKVEELIKGDFAAPIPRFFNIDYWFKPEIQSELALLRYAITQFVSPALQDFFLVAFAATVRDCSNTRRGEYKLYRIPEAQLGQHHPQVLPTFWERVGRNLRGLSEFLADYKPNTSVNVFEGDTRFGLPLGDESFDLIVTSPPYGDSQTTVAYGQFSRLVLQWLGYNDEIAKSVDKRALGGQRRAVDVTFHSPTLEDTVEQIEQHNLRRAEQVVQFYRDFAECFPEISRVAKSQSVGCFVVGNRTVKGVRIPTDQILIEIAANFGWKHSTTYHRRIPNKRMPLRNSPTNRPGELCDTMTEEHIVILHKE
ncbi:MAG: DNA methyltransferase [Fimbriimonadales bacterium]|nr:DNA methyltransferase [Fimbriimonadales bacterium]